jgi:hypothetical protein
MTRSLDWSIGIPALTADVFVVACNINNIHNKTKGTHPQVVVFIKMSMPQTDPKFFLVEGKSFK